MTAPDPHAAARFARTLVRTAPNYPAVVRMDWDIAWRMATWGKWSIGLAVLEYPFTGHHWLLGLVPTQLGARALDFEPVLRALKPPPAIEPLIKAGETPPGEGLFYLWRPEKARIRNAPDRPGHVATDEVHALLLALLLADYAAKRERAQRKAEARAAGIRAREEARHLARAAEEELFFRPIVSAVEGVPVHQRSLNEVRPAPSDVEWRSTPATPRSPPRAAVDTVLEGRPPARARLTVAHLAMIAAFALGGDPESSEER